MVCRIGGWAEEDLNVTIFCALTVESHALEGLLASFKFGVFELENFERLWGNVLLLLQISRSLVELRY